MTNFVTRFSRGGDSYLVQAEYPLADDVSFAMSDLGLVIFDVVSVILFHRPLVCDRLDKVSFEFSFETDVSNIF